MTTQEMNRAAVGNRTHKLIESGMSAVEAAMRDVLNSDVEVLRDASYHIIDAGGKRIRPRLLILSYLAAGGDNVKSVGGAGAAVELMHTASVVHDDINDHGVLRRGRPSVNSIWGRTFALLTGDFLFTAVYQLMAPYGKLNTDLANAATALVEGETLQAWAVKNKQFTREVYADIIARKTAALFQAAATIGAKLGNADRAVVESLGRFGFNVGLAFQIIDDILDIIGEEEKLGKTSGIDLAQGRGYAATEGNGHHTSELDAASESIKRKLLAGDKLTEARQQAEALKNMAVNELNVLPDSAVKSELVALANAVVDRER